MAAVVTEQLNSRTGDATKRTLKYKVFAAESEQDAIDAVSAVVPETYQGLVISGISVETIRWDGDVPPASAANNIHDCEVNYVQLQSGSPLGGGTSASYSFAYQTPSAHIITSLESIARYGVDDAGNLLDPEIPAELAKIPPMHGAINVRGQGANAKAEGVTLPVPSPTNIWTFSAPGGHFTEGYQRGVESIMGSTNKFDFKGRPAGSLLFVSCRGGIGADGTLNVEFGMAYSENKKDIQIGPTITGVAKRGWEYLWVLYQPDPDDGSSHIVQIPKAVYVERVFEEADFNLLGF